MTIIGTTLIVIGFLTMVSGLFVLEIQERREVRELQEQRQRLGIK